MLFERFSQHIRYDLRVGSSHRLLVATSGGVDSMVLLWLLQQYGCGIAIAHCNFMLRGVESDGDQQLVEEYARRYSLPCHAVSFDTRGYAQSNGLSIEMAARELRYRWFGELMREHGYHYLATAHHQNDNAETLLLNLVRGTGIRGLLGIRSTTTAIRPLMVATRRDIEECAALHGIPFRTDASNLEDVYSRNKIRNKVMPVLEQINPRVVSTMNEDMSRFNEVFSFYAHHVAKELSGMVLEDGEGQKASIQALVGHPFCVLLLHEWLREKGFNHDVVKQIGEAIKTTQPGRFFLSSSHRLLIDRGNLFLTPLSQPVNPHHVYQGDGLVLFDTHLISFEGVDASSAVVSRDSNEAYVDESKLQYPLMIRYWREGDSFVPLGMKNRKKLSDFFIDKKLSLYAKGKTPLLVNGNGDIVWVAGMRMSETYKTCGCTRRIMKVRLS